LTRNSTIDRPSGLNKSKLRFLLPLVLVLTVAAIACGSSSSESGSSIVGDESSSSGDLAPDFVITMFQGEDVVGGQEVSLHSLFGEKPIVINFWAGLCPPCRAEMLDLQEFNQKFQGRAGNRARRPKPAGRTRSDLSCRFYLRPRCDQGLQGSGHADHDLHRQGRQDLQQMDRRTERRRPGRKDPGDAGPVGRTWLR